MRTRILNLLPYFVITLFVLLMAAQLNQPPMNRFPGWDYFWTDLLQGGKLMALKQSLPLGELPALNPYVDFGFNSLGDTTVPQHFLYPLNLLALALPVETVILIKLLVALLVGAVGAYLFIGDFVEDRYVALLGALSFISLPFVIGLHYYHPILQLLCFMPLLLRLTHKLAGGGGKLCAAGFALAAALAVGAGDVYSIIIVPAGVFIYACFVSRGDTAVKKILFGAKAAALAAAAGAYYFVPLLYNMWFNGGFAKLLAGIAAPSSPRMSLFGFISFWIHYCAYSALVPVEGTGALYYVPVSFYCAIIFAFLKRRELFSESAVPFRAVSGLLAAGFAMLLLSMFFYAVPQLSGKANGVMRHHINLWQFACTLAAFVSFGAIGRFSGANVLYARLAAISLLIDLAFFSFHNPWWQGLFSLAHSASGFHSSNRMPMRVIGDMWQLLPFANLALVGLLWARSRKCSPPLLYAGLLLVPLFTVSLHNELRATQQSEWQMVARNSYRWDSYLKRQECFDALMGPSDPNFRVLPSSKGVIDDKRGRNWKLIAETEMHNSGRRKVLYSYRETMHPFSAALYSSLRGAYYPSNFYPPLSGQVAPRLDTVKLMGVKWVLSADERIQSPELLYRGLCRSANPPFLSYPEYAGGDIYVYELARPLPVAFVAGKRKTVSARESVAEILKGGSYPWLDGTVYLEGNDGLDTPQNKGFSAKKNYARIVSEGYGHVLASVESDGPGFLVLSYLYRPFWKAVDADTGRPLRIFRAYGGFMAVPLPGSGTSRVLLKYTPMDAYAGLALSALAVLAALFWKINGAGTGFSARN